MFETDSSSINSSNPFGGNSLSIFITVKAVAPDIPMEDIMKGIIPFLVVDFISVALLVIFPQIILWLPGTMGP